MLLGTDPSKHHDQPLPTTHPTVTFAYLKHMWRSGKQVCAWLERQVQLQYLTHQQQNIFEILLCVKIMNFYFYVMFFLSCSKKRSIICNDSLTVR